MRTTLDRLRHALLFELIGLILFVLIFSVLFKVSVADIAAIGIFASIVATFWNYVYNLIFDNIMLSIRNSTIKTFPLRIVHAILFECGLLFVTLPAIMWRLNASFMEAFIVDISTVVFYLIYALVFNWVYDKVFPVPNNV